MQDCLLATGDCRDSVCRTVVWDPGGNWSDSQDCNSDYVSGHSLASGRTQSSGPVLGHRHGPLKECSGQNNDVTGLFV